MWSASTDDGAVASYFVYRDGIQVQALALAAPDTTPVLALVAPPACDTR